jgi:hypothetical protein
VTGGSGAFDHCELVNSRLVSSGDVLHRRCAAGPPPGHRRARLWTALGQVVEGPRAVIALPDRTGHRLVPVVFIMIGTIIIVRSGVLISLSS